MQQQTNNTAKLTNKDNSLTTVGLVNNKLFPALKMATFLVALTVFPMQSFADKAFNYGDINDEDGQYVSSHVKLTNVEKVSYQSKPSTSKQKIVLKGNNKKVSESDLSNSSITGYGDLNRDED